MTHYSLYGIRQRSRQEALHARHSYEAAYAELPPHELDDWRNHATARVTDALGKGASLDLRTARLLAGRPNEAARVVARAVVNVSPEIRFATSELGFAAAGQRLLDAAVQTIMEGPLGNYDQVA